MITGNVCSNPLCQLTPRQVELLECLADNPRARNCDLADRMSISPHTVKKHLCDIYRVIGVQNRLECFAWLLQSGVIKSRKSVRIM